jgi:hypothetical protein
MNCLHCAAPTTNGLALCDLCQRKAVIDLEFLPIYFRNLARWRPGRAGSRPVPGSRVLYDGEAQGNGTGDRISDRLDEASNALTTWARALVDDREFPRPLTFTDAMLTGDMSEVVADDKPLVMIGLCLAFEERLTSIATLEWAGEFVRDLGYHESRLRGLTETSIPGWYAGACGRRLTMEDACGSPTYVVPGLTWVTCRSCGATTYAKDHLDTILDEARGWVGRPMKLAEAIVALVDTELSVSRLYERIHKWGQRERLDAIRRIDDDGDPIGPRSYRLGDVLNLLSTDGSTELDEAS